MNYYDSIAKSYNSLYMAEQLKKFENAKNLLGKGLTLDLGCGNGFITEKLGNAIGVDNSIGMLKLCDKNLKVIQADICNLPFKDKIFDSVFSLTALQDVEDVSKAVSEIKRVLNPNGIIILSVLNKKKISEIRILLNKNFKKLKEKENYNDIIFFTQ